MEKVREKQSCQGDDICSFVNVPVAQCVRILEASGSECKKGSAEFNWCN